MKNKIRIVFLLMTRASRKALIAAYGGQFYKKYYTLSRNSLETILAELPDIGDSIFVFNYLYGPCYFAWYGTFRKLDISQDEALKWIWQINENFVKQFPRPLLHWFAKNMYLGVFRKKAVQAEALGKAGQLPPFDWRVEYININRNTFGINIYECGMLKIANKYGYQEMFPTVCRMDYLFSHYFENSFQRTGTLADGNVCCDCWYQFPGKCEWAPEKGFTDRK